MYLSTFLKSEYLTSTCTWYIFGVLGVLEYLVNCTSPQPWYRVPTSAVLYMYVNDNTCTCTS